MRIEGYIEHPVMKITIFNMENRYSVKFETDMYEQTFKLRRGTGLDSVEDVRRWANPELQEHVLSNFALMHQQSAAATANLSAGGVDEFDEII